MSTRRERSSEEIRISRVYTRVGDQGTTQLVGGREVPKHDPRVAAYGTVDELQVAMGAARDALRDLSGETFGLLVEHLVYLQNLLFTLSGELATRFEDRWDNMPLVRAADIAHMERLIDAYNAGLPPLKDFVLVGGHPAVTALHQCRVVCRRAEREASELAGREPIGELAGPALNRLSDVFFVLARFVQHRLLEQGLAGPEAIWRRDLTPPPLPG